jgi:hypothetical protein
MCSPVSCRGIISRYPVLSGVVASGVFLAVSFTILAICLIPSLWWRYDDKGPATTKAGPSARPRAVSDVLVDRRARKRSLKRSGSIGSVKREVWPTFAYIVSRLQFTSVTHTRIMKAISPLYPLQRQRLAPCVAGVLGCRNQFPTVSDATSASASLFSLGIVFAWHVRDIFCHAALFPLCVYATTIWGFNP